MMDELLAWLQTTGGPLPYVVLGLASVIEYLFPPFPGDTIALFGAFLAATAGWSPAGVYMVLNAGAVGGGMLAYLFGRWVAHRRETRTPRFLRGQQARRTLNRAIRRFERHGAAYLALNRFVPAMRAFFFIAAGLARLPAWKVALWGGVSAALWNALLLGVGWTVGDNIERLQELSEAYSNAAFVVIGLIVLVVMARALWRRWRGDAEDEDEDDDEDEDGQAKPQP